MKANSSRCPIWSELKRKHAEVKDVPQKWREGTQPGEWFYQDCYYQSWLYLKAHKDMPGMWLVHGGFHAWVLMPNGNIFCGVFQRFFKAKPYYAAWRVRPEFRYDFFAAALIHVHASHAEFGANGLGVWGGWNRFLGIEPPAHDALEVIIDVHRAEELLEKVPSSRSRRNPRWKRRHDQ